MKKILTLCLAVSDGQILLGMKKRGFGMGSWNGFGGKVEPGETIEEAARREMFEKCGVSIESMGEAGVHEFEFASKRRDILEVHVFRVDSFSGTPEETEEMKPEWFAFADIPYTHMWPADIYWFPLFLEGRKFRATFLVGDGDRVLEHDIREVELK